MADAFTLLDKVLGDYYVICGRKDYYDANGNGKFMSFVEEHQFYIEDIEEELGDEVNPEDCSYTEMDDNFPLTNDKQEDSTAIFNVIQYCYQNNEPPNKLQKKQALINNTGDGDGDISLSITADLAKDYNIDVREEDLYAIEDELLSQCADLRAQQMGNIDQDKATYSIIQIGKQNGDQPLLIYLVDAFNRYRIQKRKKVLQKLKKTSYSRDHLMTLFNAKFEDTNPSEFIQKKCKGIKKNFTSQYEPIQQQSFVEMCQSAISVFPRRLLHKPPMNAMTTSTILIKDSIIDISRYIFQCYTFIEQFIQQQNSPLPSQIDIVIIPKDYKLIDWDEEDTKQGNISDEDEKDICDDNKQDNKPLNIGDINKRLFSQKNKLKMRDIDVDKANRTMREAINDLFGNNRCQRGVLIIDRRNNFKKDKLYGFQPNANKNKQKRCHCFEKDRSKLLSEALVQNLRICVLPKVDNEKENITVNTQKAFGLTFSFHCFGINQVRVYLCYNGWGGRFYIADIKYFLPQFFVEGELDRLKNEFENIKNRSFANNYQRCKEKCPDLQFEKFYSKLFADDRHKSH